jgi:hypothetical protein
MPLSSKTLQYVLESLLVHNPFTTLKLSVLTDENPRDEIVALDRVVVVASRREYTVQDMISTYAILDMYDRIVEVEADVKQGQIHIDCRNHVLTVRNMPDEKLVKLRCSPLLGGDGIREIRQHYT